MIKIENVEVLGWEHAIRGMRNPKNSWNRMDSRFGLRCSEILCEDCPMDNKDECVENLFMSGGVKVGPNDKKLMTALAKGGPVHGKYRRMITVYLDITAPLYWWKEFDTYKVGTVANSCSTMHKIHDKEFALDDFSHEHLKSPSIIMLEKVIEMLNNWRDHYEVSSDCQKDYWWQLIQPLPTSYNQKRTVQLNYEVLVGMYEHRKNHKLDEWREFCDWIKSLPYSELITGEAED